MDLLVFVSLWGCTPPDPLRTKSTPTEDPTTSTPTQDTTTPSTTADTGTGSTVPPLLGSASVSATVGACVALSELEGVPGQRLGSTVVTVGTNLAAPSSTDVIVFDRDGLQQGTAPIGAGEELLGIDALEDLDGDGTGELLLRLEVGTSGGPSTSPEPQARIYSGSDLQELLEMDLLLAGLSVVHDTSGDGVRDLAAASEEALGLVHGQDGSWLSDIPGPVAQGVYTISADSDTDAELARVLASSVEAIELDGTPVWSWPVAEGASAVGMVGDIDGDGVSEVAIGNGGAPLGGVHVLSGATGAAVWSDTEVGQGYGHALTSVGDWDGDGVLELIAGGGGLVRVLDGGSGAVLVELVEDPALVSFGASTESLPDVDGEGLRELVVGMPGAGGDRGALAILACHP
jgi:hypothetical protein